MQLPRPVAKLNRAVWNNVAGQFTPHLPGFATIEHRGRKSGKLYRTPVAVYRRTDGSYAVALWYGANADWVKNVLAAGQCVVETRTNTIGMKDPQIVHDLSRAGLPGPVRQTLRVMGVSDFLVLTRA